MADGILTGKVSASSDPFAAGVVLSADGDDTLMEANIPGHGFATIHVLEGIAPESFTAANFDMVQ